MNCDCLNDCGDDDRIKSGKVKPCEHMAARMEHDRMVSQQLGTITTLRSTYGADNIFDLIEKLHAAVLLQRAGIALAYAHLWHINTEPMAPIPLRDPELAANQARQVLRPLLTNEERGQAIYAMELELAESDKTS